MTLLNTTFQALMTEHNELVKKAYKATDVKAFESYIRNEASYEMSNNEVDAYIEISSNETLSGNAVIFEFELDQNG